MTVIGPTSAEGLIGNFETNIQIYGLSELNVRTVVSRYFTQRKAFLQGTTDTINEAVTPMVSDEETHKEALVEANAVLVDSMVAIGTVIVGDYVANVEATETVTFVIDGKTVQESIIHTICVYARNDGSLAVGSDGYKEIATEFVSSSYVDAEAVELASLIPDGSAACITRVARREVGTTYPVNGATKYGIWYSEASNKPGYDTSAWCAMFVAWCANQCYVPTYNIPLEADCPDMAEFYNDRGSYYHSASGGGSYTPQPGDIIFLGYNENDWFLSPGHVGIVNCVISGVVYFIDGNATTYVDGVSMRTVSLSHRNLTATDIIAYGNPGYSNDSHPIREGLWQCDDSMHWQYCTACDAEVLEEHYFETTNIGYVCSVCGYLRG